MSITYEQSIILYERAAFAVLQARGSSAPFDQYYIGSADALVRTIVLLTGESESTVVERVTERSVALGGEG